MKLKRRKLPKANVTQFTVYLSDELDLWLRKTAMDEKRTLSAQAELVLLAGREALRKKKAA